MTLSNLFDLFVPQLPHKSKGDSNGFHEGFVRTDVVIHVPGTE